ncbi:MAG: hypothetical protein HYV09_36235 [Deltaproteobacteria bacterium]|nr:hypothetical protein [Deltaproteobacteria bacterium]
MVTGRALAVRATKEWTDADANEALDAIDAPDRAEAFAWSLARVRSMAASIGVATLFRSLAET